MFVEKYAQGRLKTSECAEIVEQINNQQNNRDKHPYALPFQFGLLFEMVFDDVKENEFK